MELMEKARVIREYTDFVETVRKIYNAGDGEFDEKITWKEAVHQAIDECIEKNILKDFLLRRRDEVENMMDIDYTQEKLIEYERMEAREEALKEGKAEGKAEGILSLLSKGKITDEDAAEELDITIEELAKLKSEN